RKRTAKSSTAQSLDLSRAIPEARTQIRRNVGFTPGKRPVSGHCARSAKCHKPTLSPKRSAYWPALIQRVRVFVLTDGTIANYFSVGADIKELKHSVVKRITGRPFNGALASIPSHRHNQIWSRQ